MTYNIKKEKPSIETNRNGSYIIRDNKNKMIYYGYSKKEALKKFNQEKTIKNNPYFVDGKDMSKVPIYTLEEENNGLTEDQEIALWQYGVDTGQVWHLQGWYGRNAQGMLDEGILQYPKERKYDYYGNAIPTREEVKKYKK